MDSKGSPSQVTARCDVHEWSESQKVALRHSSQVEAEPEARAQRTVSQQTQEHWTDIDGAPGGLTARNEARGYSFCMPCSASVMLPVRVECCFFDRPDVHTWCGTPMHGRRVEKVRGA